MPASCHVQAGEDSRPGGRGKWAPLQCSGVLKFKVDPPPPAPPLRSCCSTAQDSITKAALEGGFTFPVPGDVNRRGFWDLGVSIRCPTSGGRYKGHQSDRKQEGGQEEWVTGIGIFEIYS
jgi:hypothetical protein